MKKFKSVVAILLVVAMLAVYAPLASAVNLKSEWAGQPKTGDVNGDGKVLADDARMALRHAAKIQTLSSTSAAFKAADINDDKKVTSMDARQILRYAAGLDSHPDADIDYRDKEPQKVKNTIKLYSDALKNIKSGSNMTGSTFTQTLSSKADMSLSWLLKSMIRTLGEDPDELEKGFNNPPEKTAETYFDINTTRSNLPPYNSLNVNINENSPVIYGSKQIDTNAYYLYFNPENYGVQNSVYASALPIENFKMLENPQNMLGDESGTFDEFLEVKSQSIKFNSGYIKFTLDTADNLDTIEYYCNATASYRFAFFGNNQLYMDIKVSIEMTQVYDFNKEITLDISDAVKSDITGVNLFKGNESGPFMALTPENLANPYKITVPVGTNLRVALVTEGGVIVSHDPQLIPPQGTAFPSNQMLLEHQDGTNLTSINLITRDATLSIT
jgi:hypothetical protein